MVRCQLSHFFFFLHFWRQTNAPHTHHKRTTHTFLMAESAGGGSASEPPAQPRPSFAISGTPVNNMGAGVGRNKQTSGIWKYCVEFEPAADKKNVKCTVKRKLPASGLLPDREVICGHMMKYVRADKASNSRQECCGRPSCGYVGGVKR